MNENLTCSPAGGNPCGWVAALVAILMQYGCASSPGSIPAARVDAAPYLKLTCGQLLEEHERIGKSLNDATEVQSGQAQQDSVAVGVAIFVFTPIVATVRGDGSMAAEVARLKGERAAIEQAIATNGCPADSRLKR